MTQSSIEDHKTIYVLELHETEPFCYHVFRLPHYDEDGFYRSTVSYNAFFNGLKNRNRNKTTLYVARSRFDHNITGFMYDIPKTEHASIWEFYKAIGFDYKKKKYNG